MAPNGEIARARSADVQPIAEMSRRLVETGADEISCVIFTPLPGAKLSKELNEFSHYSQCTPSPAWRHDYRELMAYRRRMYSTLLLSKLRYHPQKLAQEIWGLATMRFRTKMTMSLFKQVKLYALRYVPFIFPQLDASQELRNVAQS